MMPIETTREVDYEHYGVALPIEIATTLRQLGFLPADQFGVRLETVNSKLTKLGVLWQDPDEEPAKYFFGLRAEQPRAHFIGVIDIDVEHNRPTSRRGIFYLYGLVHRDRVIKLAEALCRSVPSLRVSVVFDDERSRREIHGYGDEGEECY